MGFADEMELMSSDSQSLLSSESLIFERVEPASDLDPVTFERTENTQQFTAPAVTGEPVATRNPQTSRQRTLNTFIVRAADCDFRPTPMGSFTDEAGDRWRIVTVADQQGGREYLITAQRTED